MPTKSKDNSGAILNLVGKCYVEGKEKRSDDITVANPFPPFSPITYPWSVYERFNRGDHWSDGLIKAMATWKSRPYTNFCKRAVESYTTFLTDNRPAIYIGPVEEGDRHKADVIKAGVLHWWDIQNADTKVFYGVKDSRKFGLGWLKLDRLDLDAIHPEHVIVDPDCTTEGYDPTWLVFEYKAQVGTLQKRYKDADFTNFDPHWEPSYNPEVESTDVKFNTDENEGVNPAVSCKVYELWTRDEREIVWDDDIGRWTVTKSKKEYPKGRVIVVAGGKVMEDRGNPYDHGQFPFIPIFAYADTGRFYPSGDIENILGLQVMHNRMMQLLFDGTVAAGGGITLCNPQLGVDKSQITNHPSYALNCRDVNQAVNVIRPLSPSRHVFDFLATIEKAINDIVGLHDISMGAFTPGNKTAEEVATLAESDMTRVRAAARLLEWSLKMLGSQLLSNLKQYGKEEWMVEVAGDYDTKTERFDPKELLKDFGGDIKIGADSTLPLNQQEKVMQAFQLLGAGVIDGEELLRTMRWPNYKEVWSRAPANQEMAQPQPGAAEQIPPQALALAGGGAPTVAGPMPPVQATPMDSIMEIAQASGLDPEQILEFMVAQGVPLDAIQ